MKNMGIIQGSKIQAQELIVGVDTVYVHTNIELVTHDEDGNLLDGIYQYEEIQYGKDEYIELMAKKSAEVEQELTSTQLALIDIYESLEV